MTTPEQPEEEPEVLWNDGEFILSRVSPPADRPALSVRLAAAHPTEATFAQLEHAYALRAELDASWAARPTDLIGARGRSALRLEDPGGQVLAALLDNPWDVGLFLPVAAGAASALRGLHQRGLIHKDVKPSNILVDVATGHAWLTGFGLATRLTRHRQAVSPSQPIVGTLASMAPEQTGRMNRSVDTRSDLYALGVTLYEMLTAAQPFRASDPLEWIHCRIARQPVPPGERIVGIPARLSAVVLKLMAKNPEDRYQTARGVEADLRHCLSAWGATGHIEPF